MSINQHGLCNVLSATQSRDSLDTLREKRKDICKRLNQIADNNIENKNKPDSKQLLSELQNTDKQILQTIYDEKTTKLELQRLQYEEATAKSYRDRERALAKHENVLLNKSMDKLFSAKIKYSQYSKMGGGKITVNDMAKTSSNVSDGNLSNKLLYKSDDINNDLKESVEYGKAAAEVARRRKKDELKADLEEARKHKKKKKHINASV